MTRKYELKKRAERQAQTRQRIVEAAVALHTTIGPARTSISAIAKQAGVQRHTVYAHFPDEPTLFRACSAHWEATHPAPDSALWSGIADPHGRLQRALEAVYGWYDEVGSGVERFVRDAPISPATAAQWDRWETELRRRKLAGRSAGRARVVRAAVGHAPRSRPGAHCSPGRPDEAAGSSAMVSFVERLNPRRTLPSCGDEDRRETESGSGETGLHCGRRRTASNWSFRRVPVHAWAVSDDHRGRPDVRQYAGFARLRDDERFRYLPMQTGISTAFDPPTQLGLDSDDPRAAGG
jgi:AcrR family transcriptional regulator